MKLTFFRTTQDEISKSQQRAWIISKQARFDSIPFVMEDGNIRTSQARFAEATARRVCEIKKYITNQIKEELHAKTLTNLGTEEKEFKARFDLLNAVKRGESVCVNAKLNN